MTTLRPLLALVLVATAVGCSRETDSAPPGSTRRPAIRVRLPASPEHLEPTRQAERYVDGSWTVAGLVAHRSETLNHTVRVTGRVQEVHRCPPGERCPTPDRAVLVDDPARPHPRLVVLGDSTTALARLEEGQTVTLEGRFVQVDPAGRMVRMEGLLLLRAEPAP